MTSLTEAHRLAQARLAARTVDQMRTVWPLLDVTDVDGTYQRWVRTVTPIVQSNRLQSSRLSASYYQVLRADRLGEVKTYVPLIAGPADPKALLTSLLVTGPYKVKEATARGATLGQASELAMTASARSASRHVLDGGRTTGTVTAERDRAALGFARVGSGHTCGFCAMLISRGPVYKSETSAQFAADGSRYHDNCSCSVEPVFDRDNWDGVAQYQQFHALWREAKTGRDSTEATKAFRHAVEA